MLRITQVSESTPFDNSTNGFDAASTNAQLAIEEAKKNIYSTVSASTPILTSITPSDTLMDSMTLSPDTGTHLVTFNGQYTSTSAGFTAQATADLISAYTQIQLLATTDAGHAPAFGSETLNAGVYQVNSAGSLAGALTLDALGNPNALFVFRFVGAFAAGAASSIVLAGGALASNVFFVATTALSIGAAANMKGTYISNAGAVALGAGCTLEGRLLTKSGAVTLDSSIVTISPVSTIILLGVLDTFALFTSLGNITNTGSSTIVGNVGTDSGVVINLLPAAVTGSIYVSSSGGSGSSIVSFSVYSNGILVPFSDRTIIRTEDVLGDVIPLHAVTTITSGQSIEIRLNVTSGTVTMGNRTMTTLEVG